MISHKNQCIFIHIPKCAGTSIEHAFGVKTENYAKPDYEGLFGWSENLNLWLQHATPQQLLDNDLISQEIWDNYYKFIIYRNSWSRAYSDYLYFKREFDIDDNFKNYLFRKGDFFDILNIDGKKRYVGDHLTLQKDYFFINGKEIKYDSKIDFDFLNSGFERLCKDLLLPVNFFNFHLNKNHKPYQHYSYFYNQRRKKLVDYFFKDDIEYFNFQFEDKINIIHRLKSIFNK